MINITLISGNEITKNNLFNQLKSFLPKNITITCHSFEEGAFDVIHSEILLLSGESFEGRLRKSGLIGGECRIVIAERTINVNKIDGIVSIPNGTEVLVVNDSEASAKDAINNLQNIGFDSLKYIPCYPGAEFSRKINYAISVGEPMLVPKYCEKVYDIGTRGITAKTLAEICVILKLPLDVVDMYINQYLTKVIDIARCVYESNNRADNINKRLISVIDSIDNGLMVYNVKTSAVVVLNKHLRDLLEIGDIKVVGRDIEKVIRYPKVLEFIQMEYSNEEYMLNICGKDVLVSKFPFDQEMRICVFKAVENIQNENNKISKNLLKRGFYAKYSFDDIFGVSNEIKEAKEKSRLFSNTDLSILIEGESGTGKELFASAIHLESTRKENPYLAINFSALNDSLMESELFGYEEGAFTGAQKGGKAGVFEMANGGTIFLDEIGDISPKMQAGLLRVLQEKEVMRVGGKDIKYVDVRIIAATHQNLFEKVKKGEFRDDLYYRLKIGYLQIPPLRYRREDISILAKQFLYTESHGKTNLSQELLDRLEQEEWYGNVRELRNTIIYMNALCRKSTLLNSDFPDTRNFYKRETEFTEKVSHLNAKDEIIKEILQIVYDFQKKKLILGRVNLLDCLRKNGYQEITEYRLRKKLKEMELSGLLEISRGKVGIVLTPLGEKENN